MNNPIIYIQTKNNIRDEGADKLSEALMTNTSITQIDLGFMIRKINYNINFIVSIYFSNVSVTKQQITILQIKELLN